MPEDTWKAKWKTVKELTPGGQGYTFLVHSAADPNSDAKFVLKLLKDQNRRERRERMLQEVTNLRLLDHNGVAKFVDSNAEQYKTDAALYLVTEFIDGPDLDTFVKEPLKLDVACAILLALLDSLQHCHKKNVLHRDIKPSNIIVHGHNPQDPVLLDFGLSFCPDTRNETFDTEPGQHIGNRFILLPEYHTHDADKRVDVSDITQCVGLLFFMLTKRPPESLTDHAGKKPHERDAPLKLLAGLGENQHRQLRRIFDIGFSPEIPKRWQSIDMLRREVKALTLPDAQLPRLPLDQRLTAIREASERNQGLSQRARTSEVLQAMAQLVQEVGQRVNQALKGLITIGNGGYSTSVEQGEFNAGCAINVPLYPERTKPTRFRAKVVNTEVAFFANVGETKREIAAFALFDPDYKRIVREGLEDFFTAYVQELLS